MTISQGRVGGGAEQWSFRWRREGASPVELVQRRGEYQWIEPEHLAVEQGNHAELLATGGAYYTLYQAQFAAAVDSDLP
jgi:hypothetical protein